MQAVTRALLVTLSCLSVILTARTDFRFEILDKIGCGPISEQLLRTATGAIVYVESPDVVRQGKVTFIVGAPAIATNRDGSPFTLSVDGRKISTLAGVLLHARDSIEPIPSPLPMRWIRTPRILLSPGKSADMLWMPEPRIAGDPVGLMGSTWTGGRWSTAQIVDANATPFRWIASNIFRFQTSDGSAPWLIYSQGDSEAKGSTRVYHSESKLKADVFAGVSELYPTAVTAANGNFLFAFVNYGAPDGNAVYVKRLDRHGARIGTPLRVSAPGIGNAYAPVIAKGQSVLTIVWMVDGSAEGLFAATSTDGGISWRQHPKLPVGIEAMAAVGDQFGAVHIIAQLRTSGRTTTPVYYTWSRGRWTKRWQASTPSFGTPSISLVGRDSLFVTWADPTNARGLQFLSTRFWTHSLACLSDMTI